MNKTETFAQKELRILSETHTDPNNRPIIEEFSEEILALVKKFGESGQSGGSARFTSAAISQAVKKLCMHEPIGPCTGEESEWGTITDSINQNNRCGALFKDEGQKPYYLNAIVWQGEDKWDSFTGTIEGVTSRQCIKEFPFTPKTFHVNCYRIPYDKELHNASDAVSCASGDFVYFIKNREQLKEVFEYYDLYQSNLKNN